MTRDAMCGFLSVQATCAPRPGPAVVRMQAGAAAPRIAAASGAWPARTDLHSAITMHTIVMRLTRLARAALLFPAFALAGCDDDSSGPEDRAALRFVHAAPGAGAVNAKWGDGQVFAAVPYAGTAAYVNVRAGERALAVRAVGAAADLVASELDLADDAAYTVLLLKPGAIASLSLLTDDNSAPAAGKAKLRVVHAAAAIAGNVDIYVTAPDADLETQTAAATGIQPGKASAYIVRDPGTWRIRYTTAGTRTVLFDAGNITLAAGQVRTVIALDAAAGGGAMQAVTLQDRNP